MAQYTVEVTDADRKLADDTINFIRENLCGKEDLTDYLFNLSVAIQQNSINGRLAGITASAVSYYLREIGKLEEAKKKATLPPSTHLGTVGEKVEFYATLISVFANESDYGISYCTKMITDSGQMLTWWASNDSTTEDPAEAVEHGLLCKGVRSKVSGTVKNHGEYKGTLQTTVTRCKVWTAMAIKTAEEKASKKALKDAKKAAKAQTQSQP